MKKIFLIIFIIYTFLLFSETIEVNPDGSGDFTHIQFGVIAAVDGDTVLVSPGIYEENINFLGKKITVASEFIISGDENDIENTIIDGGGSNSVVKMESGEDTLSYLCGFVIRNGNSHRGGGIYIFQSGAKLEHLKIRENIAESQSYPMGGGLFADGVSWLPGWCQIIMRNVEITDNIVGGNNGSCGGFKISYRYNLVIMENVNISDNIVNTTHDAMQSGGMFVQCSNILMRNCLISNNSVISEHNLIIGGYTAYTGGIYMLYVEDVLIDNCQIINNSIEGDWASGGGLGINADGDVVIRNCLIAENTVTGFSSAVNGGMSLSEGNFLVEDCEIRDNIAIMTENGTSRNGGIAISGDCNVILNRVLVHDNEADTGAGMSFYGGDCLLINSIIYNNQSTINGGIDVWSDGCYRIINSILWNNDASNLWLNAQADFEIYHSIIEYGEDEIVCYNGAEFFWGEGNIESDPIFVNPGNDDFHLNALSPGIDSGVNACQKWGLSTYLVPEGEIIGKDRDIGIYETGDEDYHFDLPAYLTVSFNEIITVDMDEYIEGMSGEFSVRCENNLESTIVDNIISWQPEENWSGFDEVWIDFETTGGEIFSDYIVIRVTSFNTAPIIELPESISFNNTGPYNFDVMQYIYDNEGQMMNITATGSEHITVWIEEENLFLEAEACWQGTETVTVYAEDIWDRLISSDSLQVEVYCLPIADCGEDIFARDGQTIVLDGSASLDPMQNGLNYWWSTASELLINNADCALAEVVLPEIEIMETVSIDLEVGDGFNSDSDQLTLRFWDDEPRDVVCDLYPSHDLITITWSAASAAGSPCFALWGYQMYFEGSAYDTIQNPEECYYDFILPEGDYEFGVQAVYCVGASDIVPVSSTDADTSELITVTGLKRIYPNPFNPETAISFSTTESTENTELAVYNVKGQKVRTLVCETLPAGEHTIIWQGDDENGNQVSSGIYFVQLKVGSEYYMQRKVTVVK